MNKRHQAFAGAPKNRSTRKNKGAVSSLSTKTENLATLPSFPWLAQVCDYASIAGYLVSCGSQHVLIVFRVQSTMYLLRHYWEHTFFYARARRDPLHHFDYESLLLCL